MGLRTGHTIQHFKKGLARECQAFFYAETKTMLDTEFAVAVSGFFYARKVDEDEEKRKTATVCSCTESV